MTPAAGSFTAGRRHADHLETYVPVVHRPKAKRVLFGAPAQQPHSCGTLDRVYPYLKTGSGLRTCHLTWLEARDASAEHEIVVAGPGERVVAVGVRHQLELLVRIAGPSEWLDGASKPLEASAVETVEKARLASEAAVDTHGGRAGALGDLSNLDPIDAAFLEQLLSGSVDPRGNFVPGFGMRLT